MHLKILFRKWQPFFVGLNIASSNGMVVPDNKPLPETMLPKIYHVMSFHYHGQMSIVKLVSTILFEYTYEFLCTDIQCLKTFAKISISVI